MSNREGCAAALVRGERRRIGWRSALLAGTALTGLMLAANPQSAYAACSGENTGSVTCDAANQATGGTLNTTFAGTTTVNNNPGGKIDTGGALVTVTAPGDITFKNNDTTTPGGISSSGTNAVRLTYSGGATGNITYTGNAGVTLTGTGVGIVANGADVTITQNALVSSTGGGISAGNGGTGAGNVTVNGTGAVSSVGSGILLSNFNGLGSIRVSGSGDVTVTSGINSAVSAQMNNAANAGTILIDRVGNISISGSSGTGINALTGGSGNVEITQVGTVSAVLTGIGARNFTTSANVGAGLHVGGSGDVTASAAAGAGISAAISGSASESGNILVDRNGNITAGGATPTIATGIVATTVGTGSVTVAGTGNVRGGATGSAAGVFGAVKTGNLLIARSGTITGATGIAATATTGSITADITSTVTGTGGTAVRFTGGTNNVLLMDGPGASLVGNAIGGGASTFRLGGSGTNTFAASQIATGWGLLDKVGSSTWTLTGTSTYAGPVTVNGGTLLVNGNLTSASSTTVNNGGTLGGTGTVTSTTVNAGATLAPGPSGGIGTLNVAGNLAFQSGAIYLVQAGASGASSTNVTGTAALAGTVQVASPGAKGSFDILHAAGGLGGTTFAGPSASNPNFNASLTYTATDVFLNLNGATLGAGASLNQNQQNVANVINNFFNNGGTLLPAFANLFNLTGSNLSNALTQLDGEAATGAERAAFQLMTQFLGVMLDPFVDGRLGGFGSAGGGAFNFAPEEQDNLPPDIALAYASIINKAPPAPTFDGRWTAWALLMGGPTTPPATRRQGRTTSTPTLSALPAAWIITSARTPSWASRSPVPAPIGGSPMRSALAAVMRCRPAPTASPIGARPISPARSPSRMNGSRPAARRWAIRCRPTSSAKAMALASKAAGALACCGRWA
jgi:hypothetical protein